MGPESYLGEIALFAGSYAPNGYALCNGQLLPISQNQALFAIIGTTYGGNGVSTFALPDLRSRVPLGASLGLSQGKAANPGLTDRYMGDTGGSETFSLNLTPVSVHGGSEEPQTAVVAAPAQEVTGSTIPPFLAVNYVICINGYFPSRW